MSPRLKGLLMVYLFISQGTILLFLLISITYIHNNNAYSKEESYKFTIKYEELF
jgi:hypothetical protein